MKILNFLFVFSLFSFYSCTRNEEVGYYDTGELKYKASLNYKNIYEGSFSEFYKNGIKKIEMNFSHNHVNGLVKRYYPNGRVLSTAVYKNGVQSGEVKSYYSTGELRSQGNIYKKTPVGIVKYFYRNGKIQHLRIYDNKGKVVDFAEFKVNNLIDKRYTKPLIYTYNDTVEVDSVGSFEVILANQLSEDIRVKFKNDNLLFDSLPGRYSKYKYVFKSDKLGKKCISGNVYQYQNYEDSIVTTIYPWHYCFHISSRKITKDAIR